MYVSVNVRIVVRSREVRRVRRRKRFIGARKSCGRGKDETVTPGFKGGIVRKSDEFETPAATEQTASRCSEWAISDLRYLSVHLFARSSAWLYCRGRVQYPYAYLLELFQSTRRGRRR